MTKIWRGRISRLYGTSDVFATAADAFVDGAQFCA